MGKTAIEEAAESIQRVSLHIRGRSEDFKVWTCTYCKKSLRVLVMDYPDKAEGLCQACEEVNGRAERWSETLMRFGVPPRYSLKIPKDLALPPLVSEWQGDPWCVVFLGANGRGKTWAATALFGKQLLDPRWFTRGLFEGSREALWINVGWALDSIRQEISQEHSTMFKDLCTVGLLLLDDWGAMRETEYGRERMRLVIQHRYDWMLPTIVTTDRPLKEVEVRLASRMGQVGSDGVSRVVLLKGKDLRTER